MKMWMRQFKCRESLITMLSMDIGRNASCPCGSGRKFKHCHGRAGARPTPSPVPSADALQQIQKRIEAEERVKQAQQGRGKPIISDKFQGHQFVAVGNKLLYSRDWKTFPDFLIDYLKQKFTPEWGNAELKKPLSERHTIMQWYDAICRLQAETIKTPGELAAVEMNGVIAWYYGL